MQTHSHLELLTCIHIIAEKTFLIQGFQHAKALSHSVQMVEAIPSSTLISCDMATFRSNFSWKSR